ncbi:aldehyde dehydrogenase [Xylona heveae TC161]|uniref:Aldehyde dehydrogenase n=1 Tax=Xylona heveae (strain CBS 132557 / TC161) TaxID=1328760 RepID=A0A164ZG16_XYLHT|nr:aldehyde dehydrogenase [Xylona heveae TC161]KZF19057.1 aldehyde dehydrogenase [Xylona heveae TC161]
MDSAEDLVYTPAENIPRIASEKRAFFNTHKTKSIEYRLVQLRKLYWGIKDNEEALIKALQQDLGKPPFEALIMEIGWCAGDALFTSNKLREWAKDEKAPDIPLLNAPLCPKIRKVPLGSVLILGAFNFPLLLSIGPLIGAIAAGNTAVLKPSENAPATAIVMERIVSGYLDPSAYTVVQGGVAESTVLLDQKWDKIFYTGGASVAKIIAKKAAETLTPVTLELGGKNPAIVTKNADIRIAARRLLWGKIVNAGQVCISQNYTLVDKEVLPTFISELKATYAEFFPHGVKASTDYARIVNERHFQRIKAMLDNTKGKILLGGATDESERFIEPTVVQVDDVNDSLITEESFGPLIPILPVNDVDEAIRIINQVQDTPLGLYPFGTKTETEKILLETRSGGASVNDAYFHGSIPTLEFGGVGESGQGSYRGKASFDCFSHRRSITTTPTWLESVLSLRYPPYAGKLEKLALLGGERPNFDRDGQVQISLLTRILALGAKSLQGGIIRYLLIIIAAVAAKKYLNQTGN